MYVLYLMEMGSCKRKSNVCNFVLNYRRQDAFQNNARKKNSWAQAPFESVRIKNPSLDHSDVP